MSFEIDPREVLEHLRYLGYRSITKEQLKEFVRDLKRLIKYEESKEQNGQKETHSSGKMSVACETSLPFPGSNNPCQDVITPDHEDRTSTDSYSQHNGIYYAENSSQPPQDRSSSSRSYHPDDYIEEEVRYREKDDCSCKKFCGSLEDKNKEAEKKLAAGISRRKCTEPENPAQPIPSFIRSATRRNRPGRCDPVALYHYYQNQWSKRPLPGEDPRTDLRWAVRTRLAQQQQQSLQTKGMPVEGYRRKFQN